MAVSDMPVKVAVEGMENDKPGLLGEDCFEQRRYFEAQIELLGK